jgi:4-hydroxybenzoate polyprenyltransferase
MRLFEYLKLIRVRQWYKNLVIFLPIFFVGKLFDLPSLEAVFIGFVALCFISSANYVLNDIIDRDKDRIHPEKKFRPLASKKVTLIEGWMLFVVMLALGLGVAYTLGILFALTGFALFALTVLYSLWLKNEPVIDVLMIAINFVIRAVSGVFILQVSVSPWLILCPFFAALLLAIGKREADLRFMKGNASNHRAVLKDYSLEMTNTLMIVTTTCLIIAYSLYSFTKTSWMLITVPFAVYSIFRYYQLVNSGSEISRHPEKVYKDYRIVITVLLWGIITFLIFYINPHVVITNLIK